MRIKQLVIRDYKAFYDTKEINVEGKNLFVYGENDSGKSSLSYSMRNLKRWHICGYVNFLPNIKVWYRRIQTQPFFPNDFIASRNTYS